MGEVVAARDKRRPDELGRQAYSNSTIRTVTPEIPEESVTHFTTSPPISPRSGGSQTSRTVNPRTFVARANSNEAEYSLRDSRTRPRTRTLEERGTAREKSPPNLYTSRHRIGSVHSAASANFQGLEEAVVTSIGHPSLISPATATATQPPPRTSSSNRSRLIKQPPRTASPVTQPVTAPNAHPDALVSPVPASDARRILKLMRATCGKMQGMLAFRRGENNPWSLSWCFIDDDQGSLVYEPKNDTSYHRTLIPDLRGCRVKSAYDAESYTAYLHVVGHNSKLEVFLRPPTQEEFDSWFAALLCWQPIRPKGIQNKMAKPQTSMVTAERRLVDSRRHSEVSLLKEAPIIKVGKMIFW